VAALVPFKRFTRAKSRLRKHYSDADVARIGRALLADVLAALRAAKRLERVVVLTDDPEVAELAIEAGAEARVRDPDPGLNAVLEDGTRALAAEGFDAVLVALGDVPLLRGEDVDRVVEAGEARGVVVVPSPDGGTALLFRRPPERIPLRFGAGSAARHAEEARARGLDPAPPEAIAELARLDLDTPEDAERLLASGARCRTADVLRSLAR
jgi:2-phospho-L-lactate guanylyltransferase